MVGKQMGVKKLPSGINPNPLEYPPLSLSKVPVFSPRKSTVPDGTKPQTPPGLLKDQSSDSGTKLDLPPQNNDGKFRLSDILDLNIDFLGISDSWKRIMKMFLPLICSTLKQKASACPLIAEIISFDE